MKKAAVFSFALVCFSVVLAHADIVVLRDGRSYSGSFTGEPSGKITFKDNAGIQYSLPLGDVQTVVFSNLSDSVSLRGGQMYTGQWIGVTRISFRGTNGIGYVFPISDVSSLVLSGRSAQAGAPMNVPPAQGNYSSAAPNYGPSMASPGPPMQSLVIPSGTEITVRTDGAIDSTKDTLGQLYPARIQQDVMDSTGAVGIPAGTPARLQVVDLGQGGYGQGNNAGPRNLGLDLYSVLLNGREFRVDSSSVAENGSAGLGMNKRTAVFTGGGAGLGALMGAVFGGGEGAGVGTLAGGALGGLTQYLTRGKRVMVPAESSLNFQLQQTMVLHP